jgi:hypothetical protein
VKKLILSDLYIRHEQAQYDAMQQMIDYNIDKRNKTENKKYRGIVLGHTHLPLRQESPDLPFLPNDSDMRHSSTFTIEDDTGFHLMHWEAGQNRWRKISIPKPQ